MPSTGVTDYVHKRDIKQGYLIRLSLTPGLQAAGYEVICLEARQVNAALSAMRNKTDKNDARGIAQILRTGWYSRVHVKNMESHLIRAWLSSRKTILKKCVDVENEIRGLIRLLGIR